MHTQEQFAYMKYMPEIKEVCKIQSKFHVTPSVIEQFLIECR